MRQSGAKTGDAALQRLLAVEIDVQCALALSRSALRALASLSAEAGAAVEACLGDEVRLAQMQDPKGAKIVVGLIQDMREQLKRSSLDIERTRELEERLIREAMALSEAPDLKGPRRA